MDEQNLLLGAVRLVVFGLLVWGAVRGGRTPTFRKWGLALKERGRGLFYALVALAIWRIVTPVLRCEENGVRWTERWLPWQSDCSFGTVDVTGTGFQLIILATIAYFAWKKYRTV